METSGFFTSKVVDGVYDRSYTAEQFAKYFSTFISNGVFAGERALQVFTASDGMKINVTAGNAWINGYWYENSDTLQLELDVADGTQNRIDAVVLRWSNTDRSIGLAIKSGTLAANPINPTISRNADNYELCLAFIKVQSGATIIKESDITDKRLNKTLCGTVGALVEQWDMTQYGTQLNNYITKYMSKANNSYDGFVVALNAWTAEYKNNAQSEFTTWFNSMKGQLSEDAAGNLQAEIDALQTKVNEQQTKIDEQQAKLPKQEFLEMTYNGRDEDVGYVHGFWKIFKNGRMVTVQCFVYIEKDFFDTHSVFKLITSKLNENDYAPWRPSNDERKKYDKITHLAGELIRSYNGVRLGWYQIDDKLGDIYISAMKLGITIYKKSMSDSSFNTTRGEEEYSPGGNSVGPKEFVFIPLTFTYTTAE